MVKIVNTDSLELKTRGMDTKYRGILDGIAEFTKAGQSFLEKVPEGTKPSAFRNRIGVKLRFYSPKVCDGCHVALALTKDESHVAVMCVEGAKPIEHRGRPKGSGKKSTKKPAAKKTKKGKK